MQRTQREDGSWLPLWFGNQFQHDDENPFYGTARVLEALAGAVRDGGLPADQMAIMERLAAQGASWLQQSLRADGSWGAGEGSTGTVEETALCFEAYAAWCRAAGGSDESKVSVVNRAAMWLIERVENGAWTAPAPIGFYFARLWYYERLYPLIFTAGALERTEELFSRSE